MSLQHAIQCMMWRCNPLLQKLVDEGKIKYVGMSEASPAEIKKAHSICPLTAIQIEYSLWSRDVEGKLAPSVVSSSPSGQACNRLCPYALQTSSSQQQGAWV